MRSLPYFFRIIGVVACLGWVALNAQEVPEDINPLTESEDPAQIAEILDELAHEEADEGTKYLLHPANTTSPRDTIISFIKLTQRFHDLISAEDYDLDDRVEVSNLFEHFDDFFDMRNVPPSLSKEMGAASAVYLREIIDRVGLPPLENIPGEQEMQRAIKDGYPARWQLPETPFEIVLMKDGPMEGHYVFSERTLESVKPLFNRVRNVPYRSSEAEDFYYYYFLTPNPIIPRAWIDALPSWMLVDFYEQTIWQWLSMIIIFVLAALSVYLLQRLIRRVTRDLKPAKRHAAWLMLPAYTILACFVANDIIDDKIFITGEVFEYSIYVLSLIALLSSVIFAFMLGTLAADLVGGSERLKEHSIDAQLARIGIRIVSLIACMVIVIEGLHFIGFSLATVIAGAGVTGLAVALAAQSTLRNIFGSIMILLDKPFRVGQRVKIGDADGAVEEIGLRSTKIRLLNGHLTSIPNDTVDDLPIENIGARPFIRRVSNITITYDTPREKVTEAVQIIRDILSVPEDFQPASDYDEHPNARINRPDFPPRVFFNEFNASSLNIMMIYWYHPPEYWDYMEFSQHINETIFTRFAEAGIEFAFPTQTIHLAGEKVAPFPQIEAGAADPKSENEDTSA